MKRILVFATTFIMLAYNLCWAALINIPADYPTIQQGIDACFEGDTVLVQPGMYVENINFNGYNLTLGSLFLITQDFSYINSTIIDGNSSASVIRLSNGENNQTIITGFTIQNGYSTIMGGFGGGIDCWYTSPIVMHNKFLNNISDWYGGGISCEYSTAIVKYNVFKKNKAEYGGAIRASYGHPTFANNLIADNYGINWGGGFYVNNNSPIIINNTIVANIAEIYGGGLRTGNASPVINNCIIWGNMAPNHPEISNWLDDAIVSYSNIAGGYSGIGNIDADPLFTASFHLMSIDCGHSVDSPCIDAGNPNIPDGTLHCSWGLGGPRSDMGAYGGGDSIATAIFSGDNSIPDRFKLLQNYPNPFNASTNIKFDLSQSEHVTLAVYDLLGRHITTLADADYSAGLHSVSWNADDVTSGVYFYRLEAGDKAETRRMVLLK